VGYYFYKNIVILFGLSETLVICLAALSGKVPIKQKYSDVQYVTVYWRTCPLVVQWAGDRSEKEDRVMAFWL